MRNCYFCNNSGQILQPESFRRIVCTFCEGKCSKEPIDSSKFYSSFIGDIINAVDKCENIKMVNIPTYIDGDGNEKRYVTYRFKINLNVDEERDRIINVVLNKIEELKLKEIYIVAWDTVNGYMIRGI